ncbi:MAG: CYTH domain-containing protein [Verrucomicrobiota bacterium]|nr:CYTH domain-containing protein [Verrucomicrobiota bacterium]
MSHRTDPHREIERKFLVRKLPMNLAQFPHAQIEQGYLAIAPEGVQVRLRQSGETHSLTFKRGRGNAREEREVELTAEQFAVLWPGTDGKRLAKTRYNVPLGDCVVEIDIYSGRHEGLVVAEVEFDDEQSALAFQPPDWLGDDVTHDSRYSNQLLAS